MFVMNVQRLFIIATNQTVNVRIT